MIPRFFIDRPIFASVLSIVITLAGAMAAFSLPLSQYPHVTPPTIQIDCNYPGASALVVSQTIASPIEQQVNGVEDMLYMTSQCTSDGTYTLTVTFKPGTNLNMAQVRVLNRVNLAMPQLPDVVRATGVTTRKRSPELLMTVSLNSPDGRYDQLFLSNYAVLRLKDELSRLPGISDVTIFGQRDYAMRVWVDPERLAAKNLTAADVVNALREQNAQIAAGQIGQPPIADHQPIQFTISAVGRLVTAEEFGDVVVKVGTGGQLVRIRDVARVELSAKSHDVSNRFDTKPTIGLAIFLLSDGNSLETARAVKEKMEELGTELPAGVHWEIGYDTSPFIGESIKEVVKSLRDSIVLVGLVVLLFLQTWRAGVIPLTAVPVAIVGTFAAMSLGGFTINNLTLFGLVLAVGIVVDDAIVVVEAVQHQIEKGYAPREATIRAMDDVAGPIIAVGVVLSAVFIPCAFLPGIVGSFFRQFALTIAVSTLISTFNSLTLSPALCALLLLPKSARRPTSQFGRLVAFLLLPFTFVSERFNRAFAWAGRWYVRGVGFGLKFPVIALVVYGGLVAAGVWEYRQLPAGFIPQQDKGYMIASIQLPDAASAERTRDTIQKIARIALEYEVEIDATEGEEGAERVEKVERRKLWEGLVPAGPGAKAADGPAERTEKVTLEGGRPGVRVARRDIWVTAAGTWPHEWVEWFEEVKVSRWVKKVRPIKHTNAVAGNSFVLSAYGSNFGSMFIILDSFENRRARPLHADEIAAGLRAKYAALVPEAQVNVFGAPAVSGLGRAGGFRIMIEDRGDVGPKTLQEQTDNFIELANKRPEVVGLFTVFKTNSPQVYLDVNRAACLAHGVELRDVYATLQATMGSRYVNDFNRFGRTWQVNVQADMTFRDTLEDIGRIKVRNRRGEMVPLASVVTPRPISGPLVITRYNMYPSATVNGNVAPGVSTGDAIAAIEALAERELPGRMAYEWTELTFIEKQSRSTGITVFALSVAFVFLILAALYESWAFPLAVILVVPVCVACSLTGLYLTDPGSAAETLRGWGVGPDWLGGLGKSLIGSAFWADRQVDGYRQFLVRRGIGGQDVNIFTQVGFVVLIGLACKNAILIVEFAKVARDRGTELHTAVLDACKLRFRPIMMTSVAFMLGVLPLAVATGAGAEMRRALGIAVLGGMMGVTLFGIFLTPVFFALVDRMTSGRLFRNRWVVAIGDALLFTLRLKFVRPLAGAVVTAASAGVRRMTRRKFGA